MCSVRLKYNGTLSTRGSGCLSFSLRTRGQPGKTKMRFSLLINNQISLKLVKYGL